LKRSTSRSIAQELEESYASERARLERELTNATAAAEPVRHALLFGTGTELEDAVALVLRDAGFDVTALDQALGATVSADLLASCGGERRLIEVKSASGNAGEALVEQLQRHLRTWDELRPDDPVGGGALVVNHQQRTDPGARSPDVYTRPEFVASLPVRVTSSLQLFDWWRHSDWTSIRAAVLGEPLETPTLQSAALDRDALPPAGGTGRSRRSRLKPNG
jgi:hypothetical protein